ncbi:hypothetical protein NE236_42955 [Actinoallomurus purpureus]|uniref:hypothetical protein n=1 Tax=Actinoallomurus purpureus TaxID=478114 RepID=UPI0020937D45|nr:hypothetical protein [Actinoallomurus purpureus]MCO6011727.1 hypothetical protein [Actinoallomurus purpureus]
MTSDSDNAGGLPPMVPFDEWAATQDQAAPVDEPAAAQVPRSSGRTTAMACAAAWAILPGLVMLISAAMTASSARTHYLQAHAADVGPIQAPPYLLWLLTIGVTCLAVCTVAELAHAAKLGKEYPPLGPWARIPAAPALRVVRRAFAGLDRKLGAGGGCLGVIALAVLGPAFVLTWWAVTAAAAPLWVLAVGAATLAHLTTVI